MVIIIINNNNKYGNNNNKYGNNNNKYGNNNILKIMHKMSLFCPCSARENA